ncbi:MAG: hypothetical protein QOJ64_2013 [Acidobacteriota bacterium]|jgi:hypothetical protein|nr:hypothetical protein [Acidobacteriota bacterium]
MEVSNIMNLSKHGLTVQLAAGILLFAGCTAAKTGGNTNAPGANAGPQPSAYGREVALDEEFKLEKDETVAVKATKLTVQLEGVRRTWYVDGKSETVDADILLTLDGIEQRQWISFKNGIRIGDFVVKLTAANPFGKSTATLIVHRV